MKKTTLLLITIIAMVTNPVSAQVWAPAAISPVTSPELVDVTGYISQGNILYIAKTTPDNRTMVLAYDKTSSATTTVPGGESLPITIDPTLGQGLVISPDNILYVVGAGVGCDSCIFAKSLSGSDPLANIWGPKHRPSGRFAWITGVRFMGSDVYFCGRFDSVGGQKMPNLVRYSAGTFYAPAGAGLVELNYHGSTNSAQPMLAAKNSSTGELMFTAPYRGDSLLVITGPTTARLEKIISPADPEVYSFGSGIDRNAIYYKGGIYYGIWDLDPTGTNDFCYRIIRKNPDGTTEVVSKVYVQAMVQNRINDWQVVDGKLLIIFQKGLSFRDTLSHTAMTEVMAFDSVSFSPVVTTTSGFGTDGLTKINQNIVFGATVLGCDGVAGLGFYEINLIDTTPPVVILDGAGSITINKGSAWNDPGAAAIDNFDGDVSSSIVITGSVDVNTVGTYVLTYTASDAAGNTTSESREIIVQDPSGIPDATTPWVLEKHSDGFAFVGITDEKVEVGCFTFSGQKISAEMTGAYNYKLNPGLYVVSALIDGNVLNFKFVSLNR